jgi:GxxExxY protein
MFRMKGTADSMAGMQGIQGINKTVTAQREESGVDVPGCVGMVPSGSRPGETVMGIGLHEDVTERILKCAFLVQNTLGCGFLEKVYENAMMAALRREGVEARQQVPLRVHFLDELVGDFVADILVQRAVVVEIKATKENPPIYVAQVLNYLKATGLPVGLLLNFGRPKLYYRRFQLRHTDASGL